MTEPIIPEILTEEEYQLALGNADTVVVPTVEEKDHPAVAVAKVLAGGAVACVAIVYLWQVLAVVVGVVFLGAIWAIITS